MLRGMRILPLAVVLAVFGASSFGQSQTAAIAFDVASVRPSAHEVGPDYNNQVTISSAGFTGHNVTLKHLVADAWHCQLNQVEGPPWLDRNEYEVEARLPEGASEKEIPLMLRSLLAERFRLKEHSETREMRAYVLETGPGGAKIQPVKPGETAAAGPGFHFRGDMREFADLLAVQFSIPAPESPNVPVRAGGPPVPVLDETGLEGIYEFSVDMRPEMGTDSFTGWKRALGEQLGLKIESRKDAVPVVVVDDAAKVPTGN